MIGYSGCGRTRWAGRARLLEDDEPRHRPSLTPAGETDSLLLRLCSIASAPRSKSRRASVRGVVVSGLVGLTSGLY